jgi:hypothetical protein
MNSPVSLRALPPRLPLPLGTICVGTEGNVGIWNPFLGRWGDVGNPGGSKVRSLSRDPLDEVIVVATDGSVRNWPRADPWSPPARMGNWTLNMLAWDRDGTLWCVGTAGNVGGWHNDKWLDRGNQGGWTLKMMTWNAGFQLVGVGTRGNVGIWTGQAWTDLGLMGGWTLKMTAFDKTGRQWAVGTEGNIGLWDGQGWTDLGMAGGWTVDWLYFS